MDVHATVHITVTVNCNVLFLKTKRKARGGEGFFSK